MSDEIDNDPELKLIAAAIRKDREAQAARADAESAGASMPPEFACFNCDRQFSRSDANKDNSTRFNSAKRCPFCKSDRIYRQWESISPDKADAKYSPDAAEQIMGLKENKHFSHQQRAAGASGRMRRKSS